MRSSASRSPRSSSATARRWASRASRADPARDRRVDGARRARAQPCRSRSICRRTASRAGDLRSRSRCSAGAPPAARRGRWDDDAASCWRVTRRSRRVAARLPAARRLDLTRAPVRPSARRLAWRLSAPRDRGRRSARSRRRCRGSSSTLERDQIATHRARASKARRRRARHRAAVDQRAPSSIDAAPRSPGRLDARVTVIASRRHRARRVAARGRRVAARITPIDQNSKRRSPTARGHARALERDARPNVSSTPRCAQARR